MTSAFDRLLVPLGRALRGRRSGREHSVLARPGWDAPGRIVVTTTSFPADGQIPDVHSAFGRGKDLSPQLAWTDVPDGTRQLVLVMEDLDAPARRSGIHSIGILAPDVTQLDAGAMTRDNPSIRWVATHAGLHRGYSGPRPLPGHGRHRYEFHIFALDQAIDGTPANIAALDRFVAGHVLARGTVAGFQDG